MSDRRESALPEPLTCSVTRVMCLTNALRNVFDEPLKMNAFDIISLSVQA
jgi:hypothetical protein